MFSSFCGEKSWPYVKSLETDLAWELEIWEELWWDLRMMWWTWSWQCMTESPSSGTSGDRRRESWQGWQYWQSAVFVVTPAPIIITSTAILSSAWTQNYSLILRPDCLIVHWRFWPLVFCGSITVFSLFSAVSASKQCGLCDCWGDDRMPADCDDRSSSSDPHHPTYPGEARCSAACRCWPSAGQWTLVWLLRHVLTPPPGTARDSRHQSGSGLLHS